MMWLELVVLIIDRGATCTKRDLPPVANLKPDLVSRLTYLSVSVARSVLQPTSVLSCILFQL